MRWLRLRHPRHPCCSPQEGRFFRSLPRLFRLSWLSRPYSCLLLRKKNLVCFGSFEIYRFFRLLIFCSLCRWASARSPSLVLMVALAAVLASDLGKWLLFFSVRLYNFSYKNTFLHITLHVLVWECNLKVAFLNCKSIVVFVLLLENLKPALKNHPLTFRSIVRAFLIEEQKIVKRVLKAKTTA